MALKKSELYSYLWSRCDLLRRFMTLVKRITVSATLIIILVTNVHASNIGVVEEVINGSRLVLESGEVIALVGVETPEGFHPINPVEFYGFESTEYTKKEIEGERVLLSYDETKKDSYGGVLAYVYRERDNFFLNAEVIKNGFGQAFTYHPFSRINEFIEYEEAAKNEQIGMWNSNRLKESKHAAKDVRPEIARRKISQALNNPKYTYDVYSHYDSKADVQLSITVSSTKISAEEFRSVLTKKLELLGDIQIVDDLPMYQISVLLIDKDDLGFIAMYEYKSYNGLLRLARVSKDLSAKKLLLEAAAGGYHVNISSGIRSNSDAEVLCDGLINEFTTDVMDKHREKSEESRLSSEWWAKDKLEFDRVITMLKS